MMASIVQFFSVHVDVRYMSSSVRLSVCRLSSVCNVRAPYSGDWNYRQYFMPFGTFDIYWRRGTILRRSSQGNPSVGGVKPKSCSQNCQI